MIAILIWLVCLILNGVLLFVVAPVLFSFNPICGLVFGYIFLRLFLFSFSALKDERAYQKWLEAAENNPLLDNSAQNIITHPQHHLYDNYTGQRSK